MTKEPVLTVRIPEAMAGERLDRALAQLFPDYSRARLQQWIRGGQVRLDGRVPQPRDKVRGGEQAEVAACAAPDTPWQAEALPLAVVYEDAEIIVIDKAPGMVVHPAAGNRAGTLLNVLLHHAPELAAVPRAGIVHRLDKDTSGLLVVARTLPAHKALVAQLAARAVEREYEAIVTGVMTAGGEVRQPIGRHPVNRTRMAVTGRGREAVTHYRVVERFRAHTHIRVRLETGRTHQIRVHMAHIRYPLVGDPAYGGRLRLPKGAGEELLRALHEFRRQALHAVRLALHHPRTGELLEWRSPLPPDMDHLLRCLRRDGRDAAGDGRRLS